MVFTQWGKLRESQYGGAGVRSQGVCFWPGRAFDAHLMPTQRCQEGGLPGKFRAWRIRQDWKHICDVFKATCPDEVVQAKSADRVE